MTWTEDEDVVVVVETASRLAASVEDVWRHATSMAGVNRELAPVRMSHPPERDRLDGDVVLDVPLFTSTLWLGPVPFDRHRLVLVELDEGRGFQEDSRSLLNRRWRHRRSLVPSGRGCMLTDRLEVTPRLPWSRALTRRVVTAVFARRHRVLRELFGHVDVA